MYPGWRFDLEVALEQTPLDPDAVELFIDELNGADLDLLTHDAITKDLRLLDWRVATPRGVCS